MGGGHSEIHWRLRMGLIIKRKEGRKEKNKRKKKQKETKRGRIEWEESIAYRMGKEVDPEGTREGG